MKRALAPPRRCWRLGFETAAGIPYDTSSLARLSGGHDRGHPNRGRCANDARLRPTICGSSPSNALVPLAVRCASARLACSDIRGVQWLRAAYGLHGQRDAGNRRHRRARAAPRQASKNLLTRPLQVQHS